MLSGCVQRRGAGVRRLAEGIYDALPALVGLLKRTIVGHKEYSGDGVD